MLTKIKPLVEFKGHKEGLILRLNEVASILEILPALENKIKQSANFFAGASLTLQLGKKLYYAIEIERIINLLETEAQITIEKIRTSSDETLAVISAMKLPVEFIPIKKVKQTTQTEIKSTIEKEFYNTLWYTGTLRSGRQLEFDGHIILIGDVNAGAYVIASGNVTVFGTIRGVIHAGCNGDTSAMVIALHLEPMQLRIANYISRSPEEEKIKSKVPEKAYLKENVIVLENLLR